MNTGWGADGGSAKGALPNPLDYPEAFRPWAAARAAD